MTPRWAPSRCGIHRPHPAASRGISSSPRMPRGYFMASLGRGMRTEGHGRSIVTSAASSSGGAATHMISAQAQVTERSPFVVAQTFIPVAGSDQLFPVRRIYCIGRNYAAHAREMGSDPTREPPFFFQKPTDAIQIVLPGTVGDNPYPPLTKNYHYEVELVAALKAGGRNVSTAQALDLVYGYALGLDMTRRDLQRAMGDEKKPWEIGKSFDRSAPLGPLHRVADIGHFTQGRITLAVN